jgi:hypothetical protein
MLELHLSVTNQPRTSLVVWGLDRVLTPPPGLQDNPHYQIDESYFVGCLARYHNYSYLGSDCCHSHPLFIVLGKLTYSMFLTHLGVIDVLLAGSMRHPGYFSNFDIVRLMISIVLVSKKCFSFATSGGYSS